MAYGIIHNSFVDFDSCAELVPYTRLGTMSTLRDIWMNISVGHVPQSALIAIHVAHAYDWYVVNDGVRSVNEGVPLSYNIHVRRKPGLSPTRTWPRISFEFEETSRAKGTTSFYVPPQPGSYTISTEYIIETRINANDFQSRISSLLFHVNVIFSLE